MKIVLVTSTFYKNTENIGFQLALKMCQESAQCGFPLFIVDESPDENIGQAFRNVGATVHRPKYSGIDSCRRQVFASGINSKANYISWLEPEKWTYVQHVRKCCLHLKEVGGDILLPSRQSLETYPCYQELSELRANKEIGMISGRPDLDWMFGPKIFTPSGGEFFLNCFKSKPTDTYELINLPILFAIAKCMRVASKTVAYQHPVELKLVEEGDLSMNAKRDKQRADIIQFMKTNAEKLGIHGLP